MSLYGAFWRDRFTGEDLARAHSERTDWQWLMENDFQPVVGHRFNFRATPMPHWNGVTACEVLVVEPQRPSYSWNASGEEAAKGLKTVVAWTLTPTKAVHTCAWSSLVSGPNKRPTTRARCMAGSGSSAANK